MKKSNKDLLISIIFIYWVVSTLLLFFGMMMCALLLESNDKLYNIFQNSFILISYIPITTAFGYGIYNYFKSKKK